MDDIMIRTLTLVGFGCTFLAAWVFLFERNTPPGRRKVVAGLLLSTGLGLLAALLY